MGSSVANPQFRGRGGHRGSGMVPFERALVSSYQGRSDGGGYRYLYAPKSAQVNFLWGQMTSERLFHSFIHPQKLLYTQNKFLATPLVPISPPYILFLYQQSFARNFRLQFSVGVANPQFWGTGGHRSRG